MLCRALASLRKLAQHLERYALALARNNEAVTDCPQLRIGGVRRYRPRPQGRIPCRTACFDRPSAGETHSPPERIRSPELMMCGKSVESISSRSARLEKPSSTPVSSASSFAELPLNREFLLQIVAAFRPREITLGAQQAHGTRFCVRCPPVPTLAHEPALVEP